MNTNYNLYRPLAFLILGTTFLLLIPLTAMQFTTEVNWTISDFIFAGVLFFGTGLLYILVTRIFAKKTASNIIYRIAVGFALFTGLFLIWVNMAVGIVGSEDNPANLMYFGVIAIGIISALIARFKPEQMAWTMFVMAIAQAVIATIILALGLYQSPPGSVIDILGVNGFFITLFVAAGLLFRYSAEEVKNAGNA